MAKTADEFMAEIFDATRDMPDSEYCDYLEEIGEACNSAAEVKRDEMSRQE